MTPHTPTQAELEDLFRDNEERDTLAQREYRELSGEDLGALYDGYYPEEEL